LEEREQAGWKGVKLLDVPTKRHKELLSFRMISASI
jgi:hypothetical protein